MREVFFLWSRDDVPRVSRSETHAAKPLNMLLDIVCVSGNPVTG